MHGDGAQRRPLLRLRARGRKREGGREREREGERERETERERDPSCPASCIMAAMSREKMVMGHSSCDAPP